MTKLTQSARMGLTKRPWMRTAGVVAGFAIAMLLANSIASAVHSPVLALIVGPLVAAAMVALYYWAGRRIERRRVTELARTGALRHALIGTGIGLALSAATVGILALFGAYTITGWGSIGGALAVAGTMCAIAVAEEVFFRGVVFRLIRGRWGVGIALGVSAVLFGLVHLVNPGATLWGAVAIAIEAGLMLGAAYLATGSLWLAIGLHFGWNFATVGLFGSVTSGAEARDSLVTAVTSGPDWLSGGSFGPEGSVIAIAVCSVTTVLLLCVAHRRGRLSLRRGHHGGHATRV
ncbi:CPBP family intramembrane glutamic endopeptidase [Microbacterium gubbeenense]|uniref:CPBP family intramembrane glutamic endopeptidase n=1 Tax=Microbacterium gubbeenense TaxID=159896 RepID=UPI000410A5BA|nr:type II CAAX endopeptidase family protein [Microbacterium gubbeenense]